MSEPPRKELPVDPIPYDSNLPPADGDVAAPELPEGDEKDGGLIKILPEGELSPEDQALRDLLEQAVMDIVQGSRIAESLAVLTKEVQTATSSLTAVPKPLVGFTFSPSIFARIAPPLLHCQWCRQ